MSLPTTLLQSCSRHACRVNLAPRLIARATFASSSSSRADSSAAAGFTKKTTQSSCAPGTTLNGLSILKDQSDPVAKADDEYPAWLWKILPAQKNADLVDQVTSEGGFDYTTEKKKLRAINRARIKASNFIKGS